MNSWVSSKPLLPLYRFTCESQLVSSSYSPNILPPFWHIISPIFSKVWSLSSHSFISNSSSDSLFRTLFITFTRYLYTVDLPVPLKVKRNKKYTVKKSSGIAKCKGNYACKPWYKLITIIVIIAIQENERPSSCICHVLRFWRCNFNGKEFW